MNLITFIFENLKSAGLNCSIQNDHIFVNELQAKYRILFPPETPSLYEKYKKRKNCTFDEKKQILAYRNSVEIALTPINFFERRKDRTTFTDNAGNSVSIGSPSMEFHFAHSETREFKDRNLSEFMIGLMKNYAYDRSFIQIIESGKITAAYTHKGRKIPEDIEKTGIEAIKKCLFKLAVDKNECLTLWRQKTFNKIRQDREVDFRIPIGSYDEKAVNFYILGASSIHPSQEFLSYYHALEYFFLKISGLELHSKLSSAINDTNFRASKNNLENIIDIVRGADSKNDETEMLRKVIMRYLSPKEIAKFIAEYEQKLERKTLTKKRVVFGQEVQIHANEDDVIKSTAHCLKHVRNAIVHASDKYRREDRHIPFSDSEFIISEFVPLIKFISERVIFGAAE